MVVENLTQRNNEFHEELENIILIQKYLSNSPGEIVRDKKHKGEHFGVGCKEISQWLNKQGEVISSETFVRMKQGFKDNPEPCCSDNKNKK